MLKELKIKTLFKSKYLFDVSIVLLQGYMESGSKELQL